MWPSEGKPPDTEADRQKLLNITPTNWEQESEREQIFPLIDNLLPFEVCLYHQILPLRLENSQLLLGMVNLADNSALDYVNRIVSYIKGTIETQEITADIHRTLLSAYLNYKNTSGSQAQPAEQLQAQAHLVENYNTASSLSNPTNPSASKSSEPEIEVSTPDHSESESDTRTAKDASETNAVPEMPTVILSDLTVLQIQTLDVFSSTETLVNLSPRKLWEELLGRVLGGGIGRLYLERQQYQGRVIWSDNGVLQLVLENLPLSVFQGVLNELKRFAAIPLGIVAEPQHIEKECQYQNRRLLLRIRIIPGINGEEATLQVLRGTALKFYQQQQLSRLSRDVISISQQLSYKLQELQERLQMNPDLNSEQSDAFVTLTRLIEKLDQQVKILTANKE